MLSMMATSSRRGEFVELDVPLWAWGALLAAIAIMLGVDLYRHRDDHEPTRRGALIESMVLLSSSAFMPWIAAKLATFMTRIGVKPSSTGLKKPLSG